MNTEHSHQWRFWPVILLSILYPMNINMIGWAIPIYFFRRAVATELIGLLTAGSTITYTVSPIIFSKISDKIPRKTGIIIAMVGTLLTQLIFYITLQPIPFLIARLCEGFIVGIFWTNLQASISDNIYHQHRKLTALYNFSWNMGLVLGLIVGAILTFFIEDLTIIFYSAPIFLVINVVIAVFGFQEPYKNTLAEPSKTSHHDISQEDVLNSSRQKNGLLLENIEFPYYYPFLLVMLYSLTRGVINFIFPIKSEVLGFDTYTVYIASIFFMLTQSIAIIGASSISLKHLKFFNVVIIIPLFITTLFFGLNTNYLIFIILFLILGSCTGMLFGISLRLVLILNIKHNRSIYSAILESFTGIFYLIGPILAGYLSYINLDLSLYVLSLISGAIWIVLITLSWKRLKIINDI
ncbi:MAG: MFS transporter [Promethearchaeota archaeon]|nr:MAG: MFS transporter [Candidatus Lokiarchaeota archaeon]